MKFHKISNLLIKNYLYIWDKQFKFSSLISIISLFINTFSVIIIILIFTVNSGFKSNSFNILNDITGNTKIYHSNNHALTKNDFDILFDSNNDYSLSKVIQDKYIIKYKNNSESIILNSYDLTEHRYNQLSKYIYNGVMTDSTIIIGKLLSEKLSVNIGDKVSMININDKNKIKITERIVSGYFNTDFLNFDSNIAISAATENHDKYTFFTSNYDKSYYKNENYQYYDVSDLHSGFINWINNYDNPLKVLVLFIIVIISINIVNNNYYLISNKSRQLYLLKTLGMNNYQLKKILLFRSFYLASISLFAGVFISYVLLYFENKYRLIKIPEYVYFTKSLPIDINIEILYLIIPYFIILLLVSLFVKYKIEFEK